MRPLRLTLKGFTSFPDEAAVSFEQLDRFAICGPTGAGKSSLLDALTFALFADAPRLGSGELADLITLGRRSFSVTLDFRAGAQGYRVTRARRRAGGGADQLDRLLDGGRTELVASGKKEVSRAIEGLLGLNYGHFTQAVFLPQGKFAEFLRAKSAERRALLNELLRLLVYERMQQRAGLERQQVAGRREQTERRLREDFAGVTEEALADLLTRREQQQSLFEQAEHRLPGLQARRDSARTDHARTVELAAKQAERDGLEARQPEVEAARREEEAASRAASAVPLLSQADDADGEARRRQLKLAEATEARAKREESHAAARAALDRVRAEAAVLPGLRDRLTRLAEAQGKLSLRDQLSSRLDDHRRRQRQFESGRAEAADALQQLLAELAAGDVGLRRAEAGLEVIGYDAAAHQRLEAVREAAVRLQGDRAQLAVARARAAEAEAADQSAGAAAERAAAEAQEAEGDLAQARADKERAERALRAAEAAHAAAHLRAGLRTGHPCPVCRQPVAEIPKDELVPALEQRKRESASAGKELRRAEGAASDKRQAAAAAGATAAAAHQAATTSRAEATRRGQALAGRERDLAEAVGPLLADDGAGPTEDRVLQAARAAAAQAAAFQQAAEQVRGLRLRQETGHKDREAREADVARLDQQLAATAEQAARDGELLAEVRDEIRAAAGTEEPGKEAQQVKKDIDRLEDQLRTAEQAERDAAHALGLARSDAEACAREAEAAAGRAADVRGRLTEALRQAGFQDASAARAAARPPAQVQQLRARVREHEAAVRAAQSRLAELEAELQGRRVSEAECRSAEESHDLCTRQRQDAQTQAALLAQQAQDLRQRLGRAQELCRELAEQRERFAVFDQLARDLRSDHFFAFLLEETLTALVRDASGQLARLTGDRYGLHFAEDRIHVVDHDNASERRAVDTLSGGETFLASLALALALSEQVQRIAGAVHLDCLFIDEGFGTLDPETLRTVSDTIRGLQVGGRMVGIVTHVPELREEFEQQILVTKAAGVSQVEVVGR
jgi:exonuclease SbcC